MAGLSSAKKLGDVPPEEIRFAVVLNGGVSLAVWMGGGVLELDRLIKASKDPESCPAYSLMLGLAGASARADVIAGTSAGGINGSALALAQVNRRADVGILRDVWIDQGQLETLLRQPFRGAPSSLMKGDEYFLPQLNAALARMAAPADIREPREAPIDLIIATTVLHGNQLITSDALGQQLPQSLHAAKFHWRRWPTPSPVTGEMGVDPFSVSRIRDTAAQLALASRASASFPLAFEPTFVPVDSEGLGRSAEDLLVRPDMGALVEDWGMKGRRDRSRFVVDGGLLANTPTQYALKAIQAMPASGPVRRVMLLVYPHAPAPGLDPADEFAAAPTLLATMTGLLGALSAQGGRTFVEELEVHNRQAAGRRGTRSDILGTLGETDQTLESLAAALFPHYRRLRKWRAARDLAQRKVDEFAKLPLDVGPSRTAWGYERVRTAAEQAQNWLDEPTAREQPKTEGTPAARGMGFGLPYVPDHLPTDAEPDTGPGWSWGVTGASRVAEAAADLLRRLVWVLPQDASFDTVAAARESVSQLAAQIESCRARTDLVWDRDEILLSLQPSQSYWAFRLGCYRTLMIGDAPAGLEELSTQISMNESRAVREATQDDAEAQRRQTNVLSALTNQLAAVGGATGSAGAEIRTLVNDVVTALLPALDVLRVVDLTAPTGFSDARLDAWRSVLAGDEVLDPDAVLTRLLQLEVANSALGDELATGSTIPVEIIQLSAQTENAFTRYTRTADDKLGGMSINRFGGFLKRSWRLNDWIWGRLDAATILCRTVLHPTRVRRTALLSGYVTLDTDTARAKVLAEDTVTELVSELFGGDTVPGDAALQELATTAKAELTGCFDVAGVAPGDLPTAMPALAHLFALAVQLKVLPDDITALEAAINVDAADGANARSRGQFFLSENRKLIKRVKKAGPDALPADRVRLLAAFDRAGIGREPLHEETSSDLMLRSGTTAAAVGATLLDSPRAGLGAVRPLTRGIRGAMLVVFWGMTALTGKAAIARSLALLALAMGAVLVTLAAFGAVPAGLAGLAAGIGISLLLLAFAYGALRSGTMLHGLVLLTPLVPVLAEAISACRHLPGQQQRRGHPRRDPGAGARADGHRHPAGRLRQCLERPAASGRPAADRPRRHRPQLGRPGRVRQRPGAQGDPAAPRRDRRAAGAVPDPDRPGRLGGARRLGRRGCLAGGTPAPLRGRGRGLRGGRGLRRLLLRGPAARPGGRPHGRPAGLALAQRRTPRRGVGELVGRVRRGVHRRGAGPDRRPLGLAWRGLGGCPVRHGAGAGGRADAGGPRGRAAPGVRGRPARRAGARQVRPGVRRDAGGLLRARAVRRHHARPVLRRRPGPARGRLSALGGLQPPQGGDRADAHGGRVQGAPAGPPGPTGDTGQLIGPRVGRLAVTESPLERPVTRRRIQGPACSRAHCRCSRRASARVRSGRSGTSGSVSLWSTPSRSRVAIAMWVCPKEFRCIRSSSQIAHGGASRIRHMSTTSAPWLSAISRTHSL